MARSGERAKPEIPSEEPIALSQEEERALFFQYKKNPTEENVQKIIDQFKNLVFFIVHRYFAGKDSTEDLIQVGMTGLVLAIRRFEPERKLRFSTYAYQTIKGEIQRYLRDKSWAVTVSRPLRERSLKVLASETMLTLKLGTAPTVEQIAEDTGLTEEEVHEALEIGTAYHPLQIMEEITPSELDVSEEMSAREPSPLPVEQDILWEHILSFLTEAEAKVIRLRFWESLPQREVAVRLGTSQMNVSRLQRQALAKLRKISGLENILFQD